MKGAASDPRLPALLLALTFVTGVVDAVSYLGLDHVFVANMTGNVVFLGFAAAGSSELSVPASISAMAAFLAGSLAGGRLAVRMHVDARRLLATAAAVECVLVGATALAALVPARPGSHAVFALIVALGVAMGLQNAVARALAVPDLSTTVLTQTLTGIAADSPLGGGNGLRNRRRIAAVLAMLAGALAGGVLVLHESAVAALGAATLLLAAVAASALARESSVPASGLP
ncbi:MAG: YoaK family protein [Vulcanimicrobiaceae bacterium]